MRLLHALQRDARAHVWDYAVAGGMVAVAIVVLVTRIDVADGSVDQFDLRPDSVWSWTATIAICAALFGRRRWPLRAFAIGLVLTAALGFTRHREGVAFLALIIAIYSVGAYLPARLAWRGVAMMAVVLVAGMLGLAPHTGAGNFFDGPAFLTAGFAIGRMLRARRTRQDRDAEARTLRAADAIEAADLGAAEERLRLAQELHDVVAHSLSIIAVQAGIGAHLIDRQPAEAGRALDVIRTTSGTTVDELRRLVEILRDGNASERASAPMLTELSGLWDRIGAAGVPVTHSIEGNLADVPAGVSLAAYRIVQEALTNIVRHAGRAEASITIRATDDEVELTVDDTGHGVTAPTGPVVTGSGHGLVGMRERAEMYGGAVQTGTRPGGGFRVRATIPYAARPPTADAPGTSVVAPLTTTLPRGEQHRGAVPPWLWDVALALAMAGIVTIEGLGGQGDRVGDGPHYAAPGPWTWLLSIGACLVLAGRRRYPALTLLISGALVTALSIRDDQVGVVALVLAIGLYTVGSYADTPRLVASVIAIYGFIAVVARSRPPDLNVAGAVWICVLFSVAAVAGYVARRERDRRDRDLAEREDAAEVHSRRAMLVIASERLRIADELGTVVARSIHTIAQHAQAGSHSLDTNPLVARTALEEISVISRDALNDLRRLLKRMRTENEGTMYAPVSPTLDPVGAGDRR